MNKPSTGGARRAALLLLATSMLAGCTGLCRHDNPPPPPPHEGPGGHGHGEGPGGPPHDPAIAAAMRDCLQELGVGKPGDGATPARPDREALDACLRGKGVQPPRRGPHPPRDPAFDAAFQACRATLGLPDAPPPPSPAQRQQMDACLKDKGVTLPPPPEQGAPPRDH